MNPNNSHNHPPIPTEVGEDIRGAIEQVLIDPKLGVVAAREMAAAHPDYTKDAGRIAHDLYPDDATHREAFLNGTELAFLVGRQRRRATELESMVNGDVQQTKQQPRRIRFLGTRAAFLALGTMLGRVKPSRDVGV